MIVFFACFSMPLGVTSRLLSKHDFVMILVQAVDQSMWSKTDQDGIIGFKVADIIIVVRS